jgi:putative ABC transport system permease protein
MTAIAQRLEQQYPDFDKGWSVNLVPLQEQMVGGVREILWVLLGAVAMVLLIACGNLANLMLARAAAREKEIAIRTSLGAGRGRILRQLLTESVLLALAGGAGGLILGSWGLGLLKAAAPANLPGLDRIRIDLWVLAFTAAVSILTGLLFGLAPAWSATRMDLNGLLKEGGRGAAGGRRGLRLRNVLVVAETALSLVLLIGAGLLLQSLYRLRSVDPGFRTDKLMTFRVSLAGAEAPRRVAFFREAAERLQHVPGVTAASAVNFLPITSLVSATRFDIAGRPAPPAGQNATTEVRVVHPDFFSTMGIALRKGRTFTAQDDGPDAPLAFVINESMAKQYFPGEEALGQRISVNMQDTNPPGEIIGIVADNKSTGLDASVRPIAYYAHSHFPVSSMTFVVRTSGEPQPMSRSLIAAIHEMDANQPVANVRTMDEVLSESVAQPRFQATLLGLFAGLALVLAVVGVYGVMAYTVGQRTREMGIRLVLGASPLGLVGMVLGHGLRLTLIGLALGVAGSLALSRLLAKLLFAIEATDPLTFAAVAAALLAAAMLACYLPARRAASVDPITALRYE